MEKFIKQIVFFSTMVSFKFWGGEKLFIIIYFTSCHLWFSNLFQLDLILHPFNFQYDLWIGCWDFCYILKVSLLE